MTKVTKKVWAVLLAAIMMVTVFGALVMANGANNVSAASKAGTKVTYIVKRAKDGNWYAYNKRTNRINRKFTGVASNKNGSWYVNKGKVDFTKNDTVTYDKKKYVVRDGKATLEKYYKYKQYDCNKLVVKMAPDNKWYAFDGNHIAWDYTGIAPNKNGWWRIVGGRLDWNATGVFSNNNGEFYVENGCVNFMKYGLVNSNNKTYTVAGGKVVTSSANNFSTNYDSSKLTVKGSGDKWYAYTKNGKIARDYTGVAPNRYGWWRIENGKVNFNAKGVYRNEKGLWYVENGKVNFGYTGPFADQLGNVYTVISGLVQE